MTVRDDFDRLVTVWLDETAGAGTPAYLDEMLDGIARIEQRPVWMSPGRWLPMQLTMPRVLIPRAVPTLAGIALLVAALLAAALLVGSSQRPLPPPFGLARTGMLVYDADGDIFVREPGGEPRLLVGGPDTASEAVWSRDGTHVAFWVGERGGLGELRVVKADGSGVRTVASGVRLPSLLPLLTVNWSPDGTMLAFSSATGQLEIAAVDGTLRRSLGSASMLRFDPAWSPDGSLIAYRGQDTTGDSAPRRVYVIRPDGTGETAVSALSNGINAMLGPNWSVDGKLLYDAVFDKPQGVDGGDIVVASRDADAWTEKIIVAGEPIDWLPRWSNDGARIVFLRSSADGSEGDQMIVNADGSDLRTISDRLMSTAGACWTPDDRAIAAMTGEPGRPIDGQAAATYVLYDAASGDVLAEMPTPRGQAVMDCSWQRLAP